MTVLAIAWMGTALGISGAAIGLGLILLYPAVVLRKYIRIMINILDDVAPYPDGCIESIRGLEGEEVSFRAVDGHRLDGIVLQQTSDGAPRGMVIFGHEFGTDRGSCVRYAKMLLETGYDVFAFDFRAHGTSAVETRYRPRQWPSDREHADMLGAIAFIGSYLEQQGRPRDVAIFGISRGAGAAILAAVGINSVKAIVTDGAFSSDSALEYLMRRFATTFAKVRIVAENHPKIFWRFLRWLLFLECRRKFNCRFPSVRKAMVRLGPKPILFIHGEKDSVIPIAQSQLLYDLAAGPKEIWIVPGAKHNQSIMVQPKVYAKRVLRFLDEHLATAPSVIPAFERVRRPEPIARTPTPAYAGA